MPPAGGFARGYGIGSGEPQGQLTVRTGVAVNERRKRRGQGTAGKIKPVHNPPRDILRGTFGPMFGGVKRHDSNRVAVLAGHQVGDEFRDRPRRDRFPQMPGQVPRNY